MLHMLTLDFTADADAVLDGLHETDPDAANTLEELLDDIEANPHNVRSQQYAPKGVLSVRAVPRHDTEVWVIWDWQRTANKGVVQILGVRLLPRSR